MIISKQCLKKFLVLHCFLCVVLVLTEFCFLSTFSSSAPLSDVLTLVGILIMLCFHAFFLIFLDKKLVRVEHFEQNDSGLP